MHVLYVYELQRTHETYEKAAAHACKHACTCWKPQRMYVHICMYVCIITHMHVCMHHYTHATYEEAAAKFWRERGRVEPGQPKGHTACERKVKIIRHLLSEAVSVDGGR